MAIKDYLPNKDEALRAWTLQFGTFIDATPEAFGVNKTVAGEYLAKQADFTTKLQAATDSTTRGKRTVFLKNESKKTLVAMTRKVAKQIGATMTVTDAQRQELGITVPVQHRTPVPPPAVAPVLQVMSIDGRTVTMALRRADGKRGRPPKVAGATIFTFTGEDAPSVDDTWQFMTATSKTTVQLAFGPSAKGDTVFITAFWTNAKNESGLAAHAVSVNLPAGGLLPSEVAPALKLRRAA